MTVYISQAGGGSATDEPLRLVEVRPPKSTDEFLGLGDGDSPSVDLVVNRLLTAYEVQELPKRFSGPVVYSDGISSDEGNGIITVVIPFGRFRDGAGLAADISEIFRSAATLQARGRERLYEWEQAAAEVNKALQ